MHPTDLAAERRRRTLKALRRLERNIRPAALNGTPRERSALRWIVAQVTGGELSHDEAQWMVARIRDDQRIRAQQRHAA